MFWNKTLGVKRKILGLKSLKIGGIKFVIKRINPLLDFPSDKMPQIFSDFFPRRRKDSDAVPTEKEMKALDEQIMPVIKAGIYQPILTPVGEGVERGREKGLTIEDLFIDREIAYQLFQKIIEHSLNRFKGIQGVFFSIRTRLWRFTQ